ncbi:MAG: hypothetical protein D6732_11720, partial [Methanobacteriota archaeon]
MKIKLLFLIKMGVLVNIILISLVSFSLAGNNNYSFTTKNSLISSPVREFETGDTTPIRISGNDDFRSQAEANGWAGDGSLENPYIIEGYTIEVQETHAISISDTNLSFIVRDNKISGIVAYFSAIHLYNVVNGIIENNQIENCVDTGIELENTNNTIIRSNTVQFGMSIAGAAAIKLMNSHYNEVVGNTILDFKYNGISVYHSQINWIEGNRIEITKP